MLSAAAMELDCGKSRPFITVRTAKDLRITFSRCTRAKLISQSGLAAVPGPRVVPRNLSRLIDTTGVSHGESGARVARMDH
jgi:hypothetical protein